MLLFLGDSIFNLYNNDQLQCQGGKDYGHRRKIKQHKCIPPSRRQICIPLGFEKHALSAISFGNCVHDLLMYH